jgi:hypothetical protein
MLQKEKVILTIENLPETFTIDELIEHLIFIQKVEEGIKQSIEGKVVSNEKVKEMIGEFSN